MLEKVTIAKPEGRLGVLIPGMGSVATTFVAGVGLARRGRAVPIGSLTQLQKIRLGKRTEPRDAAIKDLVPLAELGDLVFGGWDPVESSAWEAAVTGDVVPRHLLDIVRPELEGVEVWPAAFRADAVKRLTGRRVKEGSHREVITKLRE